MDKIILPEIKITACHGCFPEEKQNPQPFSICLTLFLDLRPAGESDDLEKTVDYGKLYLKVRDFATRNSFNLIEALAEQIVRLALAEPLVQEVTVRVDKLEAQTEGIAFPSQVEIHRQRESRI